MSEITAQKAKQIISNGLDSLYNGESVSFGYAKGFLEALDRVRPIIEAGKALAQITECFCDDLVVYKGLCETCLWNESLSLWKELEGDI